MNISSLKTIQVNQPDKTGVVYSVFSKQKKTVKVTHEMLVANPLSMLRLYPGLQKYTNANSSQMELLSKAGRREVKAMEAEMQATPRMVAPPKPKNKVEK